MTKKEIFDQIATLQALTQRLEAAYIDNGGEVTDETETMEAEVAGIRELLAGDGIDALGRWLKSKEDEKAAMKAEKAYLQRRIDSVDRGIDYIKAVIGQVLREAGIEKARGELGYSFTPSVSRTVSADKEALNAAYLERSIGAIRAAGVPEYVGISLTASVKAVPEGEQLPEIFAVREEETVTFRKPRAAKDEEGA